MAIKMSDAILLFCTFLFCGEWKTDQYVGQFVGYSSDVSGVLMTVRLNSEADLITRLIILAFRLLDIPLIPICKNRLLIIPTDWKFENSSLITCTDSQTKGPTKYTEFRFSDMNKNLENSRLMMTKKFTKSSDESFLTIFRTFSRISKKLKTNKSVCKNK